MRTIILLLSTIALPLSVLAGDGAFVPLTNDLPTVISSQTSIADFLNGMFTLSLAVAGVLAVIMISIGGFEYMGSESYSSKERAKERIRGALLGVGLIAGTFLILNTINPDLTNLDLFGRMDGVSVGQDAPQAVTVPTGGPGSAPAAPPPPPAIGTNNDQVIPCAGPNNCQDALILCSGSRGQVVTTRAESITCRISNDSIGGA